MQEDLHVANMSERPVIEAFVVTKVIPNVHSFLRVVEKK